LTRKIADMESSFQFEKELKQHESEKLQRDLEIKNQRVIIAGLSVGSLFLLLFVLALYQLYVHKKRTNLVLLHQKAKIEELNEEYIVINEQLALSNQQLTEAKEKIEKSEERLRLIIKNSNDIILLIGQDTKIKFISDVATSLTGYSTEEIRSSIVSLVHPEDLDSLPAFWRTLNVKELSIASVQFRLKHKNEDYRWFEAVAQNFVDNPALGAILSNIRDIDVQKKADRPLKKRKLFKRSC
jgi:PAS domain S-box-containing protein